jgi:hypothetical protein
VGTVVVVGCGRRGWMGWRWRVVGVVGVVGVVDGGWWAGAEPPVSPGGRSWDELSLGGIDRTVVCIGVSE